jgi:hypothetical protein
MYMKRQSVIARFCLPFENPLAASVFAFLVYVALSMWKGSPFRVTPAAYFNYLADSFLHGQLHLRLLSPNLGDLSLFYGNYYSY